MQYLLMYDISNNDTRLRFFKFLRGYGIHVQRSVFQVTLDSDKKMKAMKKEIAKMVLEIGDSIILCRLDKDVFYIGKMIEPLSLEEKYMEMV